MRPLLSICDDPWTIDFAEPVGCAHDPQVIAVPAPPGAEALTTLRDIDDPRRFAWLQRSRRDPARGFLLLPDGLPADGRLQLRPAAPQPPPAGVHWLPGEGVLGNGRIALRLAAGRHDGGCDDGLHPGPVLGLRQGDGPWRGATFYDTRHASCSWQANLVEDGPLRCVWDCQVRFAAGQLHRLTITLDALSAFAVIDEDFRCGIADQLVWDFAGDDLPERFLLTDAGAGHHEAWPNLDHDSQVTRLAPWTQCSQQPGRSDGYALRFAGGDALGAVALDGGDWRGGLNLLELWTRRWAPGQAAARRGLPAGAKADATRGDGIPARGRAVCEPHVCLEGWLGQGSRRWGLVLQPVEAFAAPGGAMAGAPLGPFENEVEPQRCLAQQGLLRRIHTRHGVLGLQRQLERVFDFPPPAAPPPGTVQAGDERFANHHEMRAFCPPPDALAQLSVYLEARVLGCWLGSGLAFVNHVVGRRIGACMLAYERLAADGAIAGTQAARLRARLAWLAYLNADANFYPGAATMRPLGDPDGLEPAMMGMANQNFFTDTLVIPGLFAEVFPEHPASPGWRDWAIAQWRRQLAVHLYPESGVWEESHTYCQHVLATVYPWLLRLRSRGGADLFADRRLQLLLDGLVRQATPADAARGGRRCLVPFGDHGADPAGHAWLYHRFSEAIGDGVLATRLRWLHAGMLGEVVAPILPSEHLRGLATFLRGSDADGHESLLALRSGGAWGHHHEDDGSLWLYAAGRGLIGDAASGDDPAPDAGRKHAPAGHSRWVPRAIAHRSHLWRFARGHPLAQDLAGMMPYSLAWCPVAVTSAPDRSHAVASLPWHHQRLVACLAPGLWLLHDRCRPQLAADVHFQVCAPPACDGIEARVALPTGILTLHALSGHRPRLGGHDRSSGSRPPGDAGADTWQVVFPCGNEDSLVLIAVGPPLTCLRDGAGWLVRHGGSELSLALHGDAIHGCRDGTAIALPLWLDPPLRGADPA